MSLLDLVSPEQRNRVCFGITLVCVLIAIGIGVQMCFTFAGARRDSIEQASNGTELVSSQREKGWVEPASRPRASPLQLFIPLAAHNL